MNWKEGGPIVEARIKEHLSRNAAVVSQILQHALENSISGALMQWINGDNRALVKWLRSDRPMTGYERSEMADAIELVSVARRNKKRGRRVNRDVHGALFASEIVYRDWCRWNAENKINDQRVRSRMKDEAIAIALRIEDRAHVDPIAVRELWDRPRSRRK